MQAIDHAYWLTLLMPVLVTAGAWAIAVWALRQPDASSEVVRHLMRGNRRAREDGTLLPNNPKRMTAKRD